MADNETVQLQFAVERYTAAMAGIRNGCEMYLNYCVQNQQRPFVMEPQVMSASINKNRADFIGLIDLLVKKQIISKLEANLALAKSAEDCKTEIENFLGGLLKQPVKL